MVTINNKRKTKQGHARPKLFAVQLCSFMLSLNTRDNYTKSNGAYENQYKYSCGMVMNHHAYSKNVVNESTGEPQLATPPSYVTSTCVFYLKQQYFTSTNIIQD